MTNKIVHIDKENELIQRAKKKDRLAQKAIYELYSAKMLSICLYYISDYHFAEDAMIKGFFKAFTNFESFEKKSNLYTWLKRIMTNECLDFIRSKNQKFKYAKWDESLENTEDSPYEEYDIDSIENILPLLPDGCRIVFNLYVLENMKHCEIAKKLDISEGTSKSQLSYAKKYIRKQLKLKQNV